MSTQTSFTVSYEGNALKTHSMDVLTLAPAMLSMGKIFDDANKELNGDNSSIKVHVKAFRAGSFQVDFEVCQSIISQISGFLTGDLVTSAVNLQAVVFETFYVLKILKGRKPKKIKNMENNQVRIEFDGQTMDIPLSIFTLLRNNNFRDGIEKALKPLELDEIDNFYIKEKDKIIIDVDKESLQHFKCVNKE